MTLTSRTLHAPDGTAIHVRTWAPEGAPRYVVTIVHGNSDHAGRFDELARALVATGALVIGPDLRGQGKSGGPRGHVDGFERYVGDVLWVMRQTASELPPALQPEAAPWFLFGHSMGGLIALLLLVDEPRAVPLRGAVVSAPLLGIAVKVPAVKLLLGRVMARVYPRFALPVELPPSDVARDPERVAAYDADPLRSKVVTAGWFAAMNRAMERVTAGLPDVTTPLLLYVGTGDRIVDAHAAQRGFERLRQPAAHDQTLRVFEGYYHELHNEPPERRAGVLELVVGWIRDRAG
jgi:alpha-beta hydrolase superfamily lysophospholipase